MRDPAQPIVCAAEFIPDTWTLVILPAGAFFAQPQIRHHEGFDCIVYGPPHLFRAAWQLGAKDYLKEPWTAEELWLRARGHPVRPYLHWNWANLSLELHGTHITAPGGASVELTSAEARILSALILRQGFAVSRASLELELYGAQTPPQSRVIDSLIARIRKKIWSLQDSATPNPILMHRGSGYYLP